jgi:hypothetical protein
MFQKTLLAATLCAALLAGAVACGGDDGGDNGDDGTPSTGVTETPIPGVTPFPTPQIVDGVVTSPAKGYSATIPAGWSSRINLIQTLGSSADVFIGPLAPGANAQPNIVLNCIVDYPDVPDATRASDEKTAIPILPLHTDIVEGTLEIAGQTAPTVTYTIASQQNPQQAILRKTDAYFRTDKCAYELTLAAPVNDVALYQDEFDAFIQSFRLIE